MTGRTPMLSTVLPSRETERTMSGKSVLSIAFCLVLLTGASTARTETRHAISAAERDRALSIEKAEYAKRPVPVREGVPGLSETPRGSRRDTFVVSVAPIGSPSILARLRKALPADSRSSRRALVTRYEYATGFTIRTWVDLDSDSVVAVRQDINYPTPLAPSELEAAIELVREGAAATEGRARDDDKYSHLVPVSADKTDSRYGHRLVWLWVDAPERSAKFLVDLTMEKVVESR